MASFVVGVQLLEDVLTTMQSILTTELQTEIDKINAHFGDGINIPSVSTFMIGSQGLSEKNFPLVRLRPQGQESSLYATATKDVTYEIDIEAAIMHTNETVSEKILWRLLKAIENCFEINAPGTDPIIDYKTINMNYNAPVFELNESQTPTKGGIIKATILERMQSYTATQI